MLLYCLENLDLYRMVEERKVILLKEANEAKAMVPLPTMTSHGVDKVSVTKLVESIYFKQNKQDRLKSKIALN